MSDLFSTGIYHDHVQIGAAENTAFARPAPPRRSGSDPNA